ncbi:MAG TPA: methylmalonyl-CoA mutase, partial [Desulfarculaceae bacterium]|nr:methylmalonyl-CoA mutase [Desulfarculaceae bacterium]
GAQKASSMMMRFHTQTAGCSLTAQQPDNNVVRVTMQALAAVLGGTNSLHTNSRDEALCLPTEDSVRIALRTQQIIAHESGVADTIDPLAGSYMIESMTSEIEAKALAYINKIDDLGGVVKAIEAGYMQQEIGDSAYAYQKSVETAEQVIVGVNRFTIEEAAPENLLRIKKEMELEQLESLKAMKDKRDAAAVAASLKELRQVAESGENLLPIIVSAVKTYATLGEVCGVLREVFGEYTEV